MVSVEVVIGEPFKVVDPPFVVSLDATVPLSQRVNVDYCGQLVLSRSQLSPPVAYIEPDQHSSILVSGDR